MRKKIFLLSLWVLAGLLWNIPISSFTGKSISSSDIPTHPVNFFEKLTFYQGIEKSKKDTKPFSYYVRGGIVPHDLFAGFIITDFFIRLSVQKPKTIVLIGPNHYERGNFKALSSLYGWKTPFGVIEPNKLVIEDLFKDQAIKVDEGVLPNDHAVAGIMPFIKYYLPKSKVVPILLSGFTTEKEANFLSNSLNKHLNKDTVIIAAVDFSHYLTSQQAQDKDEATLETLKSFNYRRLFSLNNSYLDSPAAIAVLLKSLQNLNAVNMEILNHTNSGQLQSNDSIETTSYFSIAYY